jgi:hypothetical protein
MRKTLQNPKPRPQPARPSRRFAENPPLTNPWAVSFSASMISSSASLEVNVETPC